MEENTCSCFECLHFLRNEVSIFYIGYCTKFEHQPVDEVWKDTGRCNYGKCFQEKAILEV